jgi:hypothetical protein
MPFGTVPSPHEKPPCTRRKRHLDVLPRAPVGVTRPPFCVPGRLWTWLPLPAPYTGPPNPSSALGACNHTSVVTEAVLDVPVFSGDGTAVHLAEEVAVHVALVGERGASPWQSEDELAGSADEPRQYSERHATDAALAAEVRSNLIEWTRIDCRQVGFGNETVAREAALCIVHDGRSSRCKSWPESLLDLTRSSPWKMTRCVSHL